MDRESTRAQGMRNMNERLSKIEKQVISIKANNAKANLSTKTQELEKKINAVDRRTRVLCEKDVAKMLVEVEQRVRELSRRLQVEVTKNGVLTELTRVSPEMWQQIVRAFDMDDDWWYDGRNLTLAAWAGRIRRDVSPAPLMAPSQFLSASSLVAFDAAAMIDP